MAETAIRGSVMEGHASYVLFTKPRAQYRKGHPQALLKYQDAEHRQSGRQGERVPPAEPEACEAAHDHQDRQCDDQSGTPDNQPEQDSRRDDQQEASPGPGAQGSALLQKGADERNNPDHY